jgi:hypothetical protein
MKIAINLKEYYTESTTTARMVVVVWVWEVSSRRGRKCESDKR